jgi:hypothetical protein
MGWGDEMKKFGHQKVDQASFINCSLFNVQHETGKNARLTHYISYSVHIMKEAQIQLSTNIFYYTLLSFLRLIAMR